MGSVRDFYARECNMDETAPIPVVESKPNSSDQTNNQVVVEFESEDCSIGAARYTSAKRISKNLAMKRGPGGVWMPMPHANVRVHLLDDKGNEVRMTRRLVRTWDLKPLADATVKDLAKWHIVGLESSTYSPFSPFPMSSNETPGDSNFKWDRPGRCDAPGLQFFTWEPFGILQEFLVGNGQVGGAYFQTYTLFDGSEIRIINTRTLTLKAADYRDLLARIDGGAYTKQFIRQLYFIPAAATDDSVAVPPGKGKK